MRITLLFVFGCLTFLSKAQIVGADAFIKGNFVEIGIAGSGGFEGVNCISSTTPAIPAGYHFRSNTQYFGFVANPQEDGWVNFDGDFFTPGSPENGWGIEIIDGFGVSTQAHSNCNGSNDIPGSILSYDYTAGLTTVTWKGTYSSTYNLDFIVTYTLHDTALFFYTDVKIINNGITPVNQLYYYRNFDPDNNVVLSGDYATTNKIISQPSATGNTASVIAYQMVPWYAGVSITGVDSNFRVFSGGFSNRDGSDMWNGVGFTNSPGASTSADVAIGIAYDCASIAPGDTVSFNYKIAFAKDFPLANFNSGSGICNSNCVNFVNSSLFATSYSWTFTGGDISTSTDVSPTVCYASSGTYDVTLVATGPGGSDSVFSTITLANSPDADFTVSADTVYIPSANVDFTNTSTNFTSNTWYFGDISSSGSVDASHTYISPGNYIVRLVAKNTTCPNDTATQLIVVVDPNGIDYFSNENAFSLYPNPVTEVLTISCNVSADVKQICVYDMFGQLVLSFNSYTKFIDLSTLIDGAYAVVVKTGRDNYRRLIIKQ